MKQAKALLDASKDKNKNKVPKKNKQDARKEKMSIYFKNKTREDNYYKQKQSKTMFRVIQPQHPLMVKSCFLMWSLGLRSHESQLKRTVNALPHPCSSQYTYFSNVHMYTPAIWPY